MASTEDKIGTLEDEAFKRKERLKALKRKATEGKEDVKESSEHVLPKPKFRSYVPDETTLKENVIPAAKPGDVVSEVKDLLEAGDKKVVIEELNLSSLAPRKPDWDLKRDVVKKLEKLEKRTQRAIAELIRDRLKNEQSDLASAVNLGASVNQKLDVDDD
ncbi:unnamed protein product [Bemisia tabaci]|uniref:Coiled-coil domain-containing protein 12 n=1 Tax=Bemisia tabaci TaxID=7038 RepID=A0A9P0AFA0_BEMTA|nr:PREDICTED: coiled-coil domain-containing protein 12 [Bemisia tabaci]CAH0391917.1 unnamed protein product [Bemisia tabaci]